jgi:hypothetical protein
MLPLTRCDLDTVERCAAAHAVPSATIGTRRGEQSPTG